MGRSRHQLTIRIPIPSQLPVSAVVDALHSHSPLIRHQALVTRFQRRPVELSTVVDDSFFLASGQRLSRFDVYEKITFVPGVAHKEISFPVIFQSVENGVRARADAPAGVRLWSETRVEKRKVELPRSSDGRQSTGSRGGGGGGGRASREKVRDGTTTTDDGGHLASTSGYDGFANGAEVYDLVEEVLVEANSMLMPFVSRSMEGAHREICQKVIWEVAEKLGQRPQSSRSL